MDATGCRAGTRTDRRRRALAALLVLAFLLPAGAEAWAVGCTHGAAVGHGTAGDGAVGPTTAAAVDCHGGSSSVDRPAPSPVEDRLERGSCTDADCPCGPLCAGGCGGTSLYVAPAPADAAWPDAPSDGVIAADGSFSSPAPPGPFQPPRIQTLLDR